MKKFITEYARYKRLKKIGYYRFCWCPALNSFTVIEFFGWELKRLDKNKIELICK